MADGTYLYQGDEKTGFLRIERLADAHIVAMPSHSITIKTRARVRELVRVSRGDCKTVFHDLLWASGNPETPRLVVETKDQSYYSVLLDHTFAPTMKTVGTVADELGLEITHGQRRKLAFLIRANEEKPTGIKRFHGTPKWPDLRTPRNLGKDKFGSLVMSCEKRKFPNGGIYAGKTDDARLYFDGVSFDELAQYFEVTGGFPVVNQTKDKLLYSFTLPDDIGKRFSFEKTVPLPGLGLSVTSGEAEMEVILVRDKSAEKAAKRSSSDAKDSPK